MPIETTKLYKSDGALKSINELKTINLNLKELKLLINSSKKIKNKHLKLSYLKLANIKVTELMVKKEHFSTESTLTLQGNNFKFYWN